MLNKGKRIIICRPTFYCGGSLALSALCKILCEHGYDARLFFFTLGPHRGTSLLKIWLCWLNYIFHYLAHKLICKIFKGSDNPTMKLYQKDVDSDIKGLPRKLSPFFSRENTIVIYPESIYGNFLHAKNVVRWLLYHNKYVGDSKAFGKDDLFIAYRDIFNDPVLNPNGCQSEICYFDKELYHQYNFNERKGKCYIIRKGVNRLDLPNDFDGPIIDDLPEEEKVKVLNECKYCYSYDTQTFYMTIAAVCGCIPVVRLEPGKKKGDYLSPEEQKNLTGVAYGDEPEEIAYAVNTREEKLKSLDFTKSNEENLDKFLTYLSSKFGELKKI